MCLFDDHSSYLLLFSFLVVFVFFLVLKVTCRSQVFTGAVCVNFRVNYVKFSLHIIEMYGQTRVALGFLVFCITLHYAHTSNGDRSQFFKNCMKGCLYSNCTEGI